MRFLTYIYDLKIPFFISLVTILELAVSNAFLVVIPIVDWLNLTPSSSIPSKIEIVLTVDYSHNPEPTITSPVSASTNLTCRPNLVVCVVFDSPFTLTTSSSDTEKSYTSI